MVFNFTEVFLSFFYLEHWCISNEILKFILNLVDLPSTLHTVVWVLLFTVLRVDNKGESNQKGTSSC